MRYLRQRNVGRDALRPASGSSCHHAAIRSAGVGRCSDRQFAPARSLTSIRAVSSASCCSRASGVSSCAEVCQPLRSLVRQRIARAPRRRIATSSCTMRAATARSTQPDRSITAKRASLSASLSSIGAAETTIRMSGIIRMLIQNPRVRTFSRYSRVATSSALARFNGHCLSPTARTKISCSDASRVSNRRIVSRFTRLARITCASASGCRLSSAWRPGVVDATDARQVLEDGAVAVVVDR